MKTTNFVVYECIEERKSGLLLGEFDSISDVVKRVNELYPIQYKFEPKYPHVWVLSEEVSENGREAPVTYCYFAQ